MPNDKFLLIGARHAAALRQWLGLSSSAAASLSGVSEGALLAFETDRVPLEVWQSISIRLNAFYSECGGRWCADDLHDGLHSVRLIGRAGDDRLTIRAALALMGYRASAKPWARPTTPKTLVERIRKRVGADAVGDLGLALAGRKPLSPMLVRECFYELQERGGRYGGGCRFDKAEGGGWNGIACDPNGCWW